MVARRVFAAERVCGGGFEADGEGLWAWREVEAVENIYVYNMYNSNLGLGIVIFDLGKGAGRSRERAFSVFKILFHYLPYGNLLESYYGVNTVSIRYFF